MNDTQTGEQEARVDYGTLLVETRDYTGPASVVYIIGKREGFEVSIPERAGPTFMDVDSVEVSGQVLQEKSLYNNGTAVRIDAAALEALDGAVSGLESRL